MRGEGVVVWLLDVAHLAHPGVQGGVEGVDGMRGEGVVVWLLDVVHLAHPDV